jgi:soluble lytic murein transglycosylase-like protein
MKMMTKIPTPIQVSVALLTFILYAVITAGYLNQPPAATAALTTQVVPEPLMVSPMEITPIPVPSAIAVPEPAWVALTPVGADLLDQGVCQDAAAEDGDNADHLLQSADEVRQPLSDEAPPEEPQKPVPPFHFLILQAAHAHDIEPALIRAVILAESNYNPRAISKRGARGLMQLMPRTAAALGVEDLFDPADNINGGVKYLRQLLDRFDNDMRLALAAYNAGSRHVRNYNGVPPFRATRLYIKKVFKYKGIFQQEMIAGRQTG